MAYNLDLIVNVGVTSQVNRIDVFATMRWLRSFSSLASFVGQGILCSVAFLALAYLELFELRGITERVHLA
ncbi:hypothetical protein LINGRAHAP2_LOCUS17525 [Linum grandiflorum]